MIVTVSTKHCASAINQALTNAMQCDNKIDLEQLVEKVLLDHGVQETTAIKAIDQNVEAVVEKHRSRAAVGLKKYGVTTERGDLTVSQWLQHAQDEAMDLAIYLERLMFDLRAREALAEEREWDEALANPACVSSYDGPEDSFDFLV